MKALIFKTDLPRIGAAFLFKKITKKITLYPGHPLQLVEINQPDRLEARYVKVKTRLCGICGTDLRILSIDLSPKSAALAFSSNRTKLPMFLGHEIIGEIVEIGEGVQNFKVGQRVTLMDEISCSMLGGEACVYCQDGMPILCLRRNEGTPKKNMGGGWSEYFVRHESQLLSVPDDITDENGVLLEPLACSMHAVLRKPPKSGDKVLVLGGGIIGLGVVAAIRSLNLKNVHITVSARHPYQCDRAMGLGADSVVPAGDMYEGLAGILNTQVLGKGNNRILHEGFHIVYDCVGNESTLNDSLRWLRPRGWTVLIGMNMVPGEIDFTPIWQRELNIIGIHGYAMDQWEGEEVHTMDRCRQWISSGRLKTAGLLTHRFPLERYQEAISVSTSHHTTDSDKAEKNKAIKVVFDFRDGN